MISGQSLCWISDRAKWAFARLGSIHLIPMDFELKKKHGNRVREGVIEIQLADLNYHMDFYAGWFTSQASLGCNYLSLPLILAFGTQVHNWGYYIPSNTLRWVCLSKSHARLHLLTVYDEATGWSVIIPHELTYLPLYGVYIYGGHPPDDGLLQRWTLLWEDLPLRPVLWWHNAEDGISP